MRHIFRLFLLWLIAITLSPAVAAEPAISYSQQSILGKKVHVISVDMNNPRIKVTPFLCKGFPGGMENFDSMCRRSDAVAAINGAYFSMTTFCLSAIL